MRCRTLYLFMLGLFGSGAAALLTPAGLNLVTAAAGSTELSAAIQCYNQYAQRFGSVPRTSNIFQVHPQDTTLYLPLVTEQKRGIVAINTQGAVFQDAGGPANETNYFTISRPQLPPQTKEKSYTWWIEVRPPGTAESVYAELSHWTVSNEHWVQFWKPQKDRTNNEQKLNYHSSSYQKPVTDGEALALVQKQIRATIAGTYDLAHGASGFEQRGMACSYLHKLLGELKAHCTFALDVLEQELGRFSADPHCMEPSVPAVPRPSGRKKSPPIQSRSAK